MRAHRVVILQVALEDVAQVLLACHQNVVQAFPADRADQALGIPVLPRRACRRRMIANAERANATNEYAAVTSIPITDQIRGPFSQPQAAVSWLAIHYPLLARYVRFRGAKRT